MSAPEIRLCMHASCYPPAFGGQGIQYQCSMPAFAACGLRPSILTRRLPPGVPDLEHPIPVYRELTSGGQGKLLQLRREAHCLLRRDACLHERRVGVNKECARC